VIREWFEYSWKFFPIRRVASPILTQSQPPAFSTRQRCPQTFSSSACISSKAAEPSWPRSVAATSGLRRPNSSSHIWIIGYGGEVTTS